jgi:phytoene dehydrogenase-like protein
MKNDVVVVGGGMAGLTAAAYLCQAGLKVLLCEQNEKVGGLVNSFDYHGFVFDGGIRAIESSGIVIPMLRQLGIDVPFVRNKVSIGIEKNVISYLEKDSLQDYLHLLRRCFPENGHDIEKIGLEITKIMHDMDVLYGIDNPLFMDLKGDTRYLTGTFLPWLFKYLLTIRKITRLDKPVVDFLMTLTNNRALVDMIAQHFFQKTPAFFAMSYFSLYLDYHYPVGGTGMLAEKMRQYILEHHGEIKCDTEINRLDLTAKEVQDTHGNRYPYKKLIWAADLKRLYKTIDLEFLVSKKTRESVVTKKKDLSDKTGGDSVLTLYLTLGLDKQYFMKTASPHFFYTPQKTGLSSLGKDALMQPGRHLFTQNQQIIREWLKQYYRLTTYEISCPVNRDEHLAPEGKTGLIVSTLFDYSLTRHIAGSEWYDAFKELSAQTIIDVLDASIYPGIKEAVIDAFVSTPLSLEKLTGNSDGAITGWAFTNQNMPVIHRMPQIAKSVLTRLPHVYQAGQWVFSPSGLPTSILTGKLAADQVIKSLSLR